MEIWFVGLFAIFIIVELVLSENERNSCPLKLTNSFAKRQTPCQSSRQLQGDVGKKVKIIFKDPNLPSLISTSGNCEEAYIAVSLSGNIHVDQNLYCDKNPAPESLVSKENVLLVTVQSSECTTPDDLASFEFIEANSKECGVINLPAVQENERFPKIVNGDDVDPPNKYPFMVALVHKLNTSVVLCGGSLLSKSYVLTVAHCMDESILDKFLIVLGGHDIFNFSEPLTPSEIYTHDDYVSHSAGELYHNDIAIIKLKDPIQFTDTVSPVSIPWTGFVEEADASATVIGWGKMEQGDYPRILQEADVKLMTNSRCTRRTYITLLDSHICAVGEGKEDACERDSGSPLFIIRQGKAIQVGIVSAGVGCGDAPGFYTRVSSFVDWIMEITKDDPACQAIEN